MADILIFTTTTGGAYTVINDNDGITVMGQHSNLRACNLTGDNAGTVIHPEVPQQGPMFWVGWSDPVEDGVWDHTREIRTGPIDTAFLNGHPITPTLLHELTSVDHQRVPIGNGVLSDPDLSPVVTHQEHAYLGESIADILDGLFRGGDLFAEYV